jgi:hypothetical protein
MIPFPRGHFRGKNRIVAGIPGLPAARREAMISTIYLFRWQVSREAPHNFVKCCAAGRKSFVLLHPQKIIPFIEPPQSILCNVTINTKIF